MTPVFMQKIGHFTFNYWAVTGINAIGKRDEFHSFEKKVKPRLSRLEAMERCFIYTPEWVCNGDRGIATINLGVEMGQHCLMNAIQANLMFDDGCPMDSRLPQGLIGWIDEVNRT
ncbi:MAG TPA: hypothetical protein VJY54_08910 [Lachnospiraceae bacterium]|nr:hypothetical protein [Lachnospiraceae bacterium]